jgi:putative ABC transport system substrate-binding protein
MLRFCSARVFDWGEKQMRERIWMSFPNFRSDNRKSAIQNPKWLGLLIIVFVLVVAGAVAQAQQPTKIPRIGFLIAASPSSVSARLEAFRQGLRELGYVEGKNIVIEWRYAEGKLDRLPALVAELVRLKIDIIVTGAPATTRAAKEATVTIPIVMAQDTDPVANGFVASLARPGGNITGLSTFAPELSGKQLELLKETVPLQYVDVLDLKDIETAFRAVSKGRADAVLVLGNPIFLSQRIQITDLAVKSRRPAIYERPEYVDDGGLMTYGVNINELYRRAATYVDKILNGAKAADLAVEQPTKFEFIINLKAAKQIGLTITPSVLARADRVIR